MAEASPNKARPGEALVEAEALACRRAGRLVFRDLGLAVHAGEALLLRGPNGSGKSSLLRLLAGLLQPALGALCYQGVSWREAEIGTLLHYVGHQDPIKPGLSVAENVTWMADLLGGGEVRAGLLAMGLEALADTPGKRLSSGQRRRAGLARLAAVERPLWLLDEPGVGLDADHRGRLEGLIQAHRAKGGAVIAATHGDVSIDDAAVLEFDVLLESASLADAPDREEAWSTAW